MQKLAENELKCAHCGNNHFFLTETVFNNGTKHVKSSCTVCDKFFRFVPQQTEEMVIKQQEQKITSPEDVVLPFGKHKNKKLSEVPVDYLQWAAKNFDSKWRITIQNYLDKK